MFLGAGRAPSSLHFKKNSNAPRVWRQRCVNKSCHRSADIVFLTCDYNLMRRSKTYVFAELWLNKSICFVLDISIVTYLIISVVHEHFDNPSYTDKNSRIFLSSLEGITYSCDSSKTWLRAFLKFTWLKLDRTKLNFYFLNNYKTYM